MRTPERMCVLYARKAKYISKDARTFQECFDLAMRWLSTAGRLFILLVEMV